MNNTAYKNGTTMDQPGIAPLTSDFLDRKSEEVRNKQVEQEQLDEKYKQLRLVNHITQLEPDQHALPFILASLKDPRIKDALGSELMARGTYVEDLDRASRSNLSNFDLRDADDRRPRFVTHNMASLAVADIKKVKSMGFSRGFNRGDNDEDHGHGARINPLAASELVVVNHFLKSMAGLPVYDDEVTIGAVLGSREDLDKKTFNEKTEKWERVLTDQQVAQEEEKRVLRQSYAQFVSANGMGVVAGLSEGMACQTALLEVNPQANQAQEDRAFLAGFYSEYMKETHGQTSGRRLSEDWKEEPEQFLERLNKFDIPDASFFAVARQKKAELTEEIEAIKIGQTTDVVVTGGPSIEKWRQQREAARNAEASADNRPHQSRFAP